jgi:hypothetical protein
VRDLPTIYNTYLRNSRVKRNLPFKKKIDFSGIESDPKYVTLLKLENFFKRNPYINLNDYFEAPYEVYKDEKYFELDFFLTQKAVKVYNIFEKKKLIMDPDSDLQRSSVINGLEFIYNFCKNNSLTLDQYMMHKTNVLSTVFLHLKEKNISIYNCLAFSDFQSVVNQYNYEMLEFMLGDTISKISFFRTKFYSSKKCIKISLAGLKILKEKLAIHGK